MTILVRILVPSLLFHGNWDDKTVVKNAVLSPFQARFVRFIPNECSADDCVLAAKVYFLVPDTTTNIFSLAANDSLTTGLALFKNSDSSTYDARVRTMEGLAWTLSFNTSHESHDWVHVTITRHEMWGLTVYINGEIVQANNLPEEVPIRDLVSATHIEIGGVTSDVKNASSLGTNLQMSDLRIWERFVSQQEVLANFKASVDVSSGLWYVIKKENSYNGRWLIRSSCTVSSGTGPCDDGAPAEFRSYCFSPLGLESGLIFDSQITASSFVGSRFKSQNARLHSTNCWSPSDANPWIEIKLYQFTRITRIATQGRRDADEWVTQYYIHYGRTWWSALADYADGSGNREYFTANSDRSTVVTNYIFMEAMILRIYPTAWYNNPSLRMELYGCYKDERNFMFIESSFPRVRGEKARLVTLYATESHNCLSFNYHMNGLTIGRLNVYARGPDAEETLLWRIAGSQGDAWRSATVPIARTNPYQIVIEGVIGDGYTGDIAVDNVRLSVSDECTFEPANARQEMSGIRSDMLKNGPGYQDKLMQLLAEEGFGDKYWVPCFRGSVDGWNASVFQSQCASKKATVTIIRKGDCLFGGFTDKAWGGSVAGFTPSTKSFLFTLQSPSSPPLGEKWPVYSSERFHAIFRASGRLQFGEDLLLNLTDRSVYTAIGYYYNRTNGSGLNDSPCGASDTVVEVDDLEVLSPFDTLCDPPCLHGQFCDEIGGRCICNDTKRDVQRCYERAANYPLLQLEDHVLKAEFYFPMDNPAHVHTSRDNVLRWSSGFTGKTVGVKDNAVFTKGDPNAVFLFNDTGCISDPKLCKLGITLMFWLKHTNKEAGQTFLSTGGNGIKEVNKSRGLRVFQLNNSFDHVAVEMRNEFESCLWVFTAPQSIWSHFVIAFDSISSGSCGILKFFFNGKLQSPLFSDVKTQNQTEVSPVVQIGDSASGSPMAAFDDLIIWYETLADADISKAFEYYKATQFTVNLNLERDITDDKGPSYYTDLEEMEKGVTSTLFQQVNLFCGGDQVKNATVRKYGYTENGTKTQTAYMTVVFHQSSEEALDLLRVGTVISNTWTLVDVQSHDVDVHGISISASNKTNVASINVTTLASSVESLQGIFHGYIIFYKELGELNYKSERIFSAQPSHLITGLKHWTLYSVYVRVATLNGVGKRSNSQDVWTKFTAPTNISVHNVDVALHVQWANINSSTVKQYRVHVTPADNVSSLSCEVIVPAVPGGSAACENLQTFVNYSITVSGEGFILGDYSEPIYFTIVKDAPDNISAQAIGPFQILVEWTAMSFDDLIGYLVLYRNVDNNGTVFNLTVDKTSGSSVTLDGLLPGSNYSIQVSLLVDDFQGKPSDQLFVVTEELLTVAPDGFNSSSTGPTSIRLQWNELDFESLKGYVIYYRQVNKSGVDNNSETWNVVEVLCNNSLVLFNLEPLTNYSVQIAGFTRYHVGPKTEPITIETQRQPLDKPPASLDIYAWSTTRIHVSWSPISFQSLRGYVIFYKPLNSVAQRKRRIRSLTPFTEYNVTITSIDTNSTFVSGLNQFYNYSVQAAGFTDFELGPRTNTVYILTNQTVPRVPPANVIVTSLDGTRIQVCWDKIPHFNTLEEYVVHYNSLRQANISVSTTDANTTSVTVFGLNSSFTYAFSVAGKSVDGVGPFTSPINVQPKNYTVAKPTAFPRGNSTILVCFPMDMANFSLTLVYRDVNVSESLAKRLNIDLSQPFVKITGLVTRVNYSIQLEQTGCGENQKTEAVYVVTGKRGPLASPRNITVNSTFSTIRVKWLPNPSLLVEAYVIECAELPSGNTIRTELVNATNTTVEIDGLEASTNYSVRLHTVTWCKNGSWSKALIVSTKDGVPSRPPVNVSVWKKTATSLYVKWSPVPLKYRNGIILGYNVTYWRSGDNSNLNETLTTDKLEIEITGLECFTAYMVVVAAFNRIGFGVTSDPQEAWTDEKVPDLPPPDLTAENHTSLSTIPVSWRPIPAQNICGILLEYRVRFTPVQLVDGTEINGTTKEKVVPARTLSTTLDALEHYTVYRIEVWGATSKGGGPWATTFAETCHCQKRLSTNLMIFPPYVEHVTDTSTSGSPIGGIIPPILADMVSSCCAYCKSHGETYVDFITNGSSPQSESYNDMTKKISHDTDFAFPVYGKKGQLNYKNEYRFIDLIQSPGVAHVINTHDPNRKNNSFLAAIYGLWPILTVTMVTVYLAGIVVWYLERKENAEQFKPSFIRGTGEGVWWSYISATTVGYGDRAPVTYYGRLFSVFWILMGLVIIGILNGSITTAITSFTVNYDFSVYGQKVAAVHQSPEFRIGLRKNANMDNATYKTFREVFTALESGKVKHALFDAYAIGSEKALFENAPHLHIYEIYDYESTYGIVIGGGSGVLQKCFNAFKIEHIEDIFKNIKDSIDSIKQGKDLSVEMSTGLFDISSPLFKNTLLYCGYCFAVALIMGVIWEIWYRCKGKNQINNEDDGKEKIELIKEMRTMVEDLHQRMLQISADLKAKHLKELLQLQKLKGKDGRIHGKEGNQENYLPKECGLRLRSKRETNPENYAVNLSYPSTSVENYYDNMSNLMKRGANS
ncbi:hypothetical protein ACROYT_G035784 [Oculina patagonica]